MIEAAESAGRKIRGILDLPELIGTYVCGYEIIGTDDDIPKYVGDCEFIVSLGSIEHTEPRIRLHNMIKEAGGTLAIIKASTAVVSRHAEVGAGTVVLHHALVNANAKVGESVIINSAALVEHDAEVGDLTHVSTGARINGACKVGERCFVGSGAVLVQGVSTVDDVFIGAGSLLARDAAASGTYIGYPARKMK